MLVYFYPKADTPGCTTQSCGLRDVLGDIGDTAVLGISPDKPATKAPTTSTAWGSRCCPTRTTARVVWGLGREVDVRPQVHGHHPLRSSSTRTATCRGTKIIEGHADQAAEGARRLILALAAADLTEPSWPALTLW